MRRQLLEVMTGGEGAAGAGDDDGTNGIAAADLFDRAGDGRDQLLGQTVARVRPVQRQDRDRALVLALKDVASCHALFRSVVHPSNSYPSAKLEPYIRGIVALC